MFSKFSLKTKLLGIFCMLSILLFSVGVVGFFGLKQTTEKFEHITNINIPNIMQLATMRSNSKDLFRALVQLTLYGNGPEEISRLKNDVEKYISNFEKADKIYNEIEFVEGEDILYKRMRETWLNVLKSVEKTLPLAVSTLPADRATFGELYRGEFYKQRLEFYKEIDALFEFHNAEVAKWIEDAEMTGKKSIGISSVIVLIGFISSMILGVFFTRGITRTLTRVADELSKGATEVAVAANQISSTSENLSSATTEQAAAVQETSASVEELTAMVAKNVENADQSKIKSNESKDVTLKGQIAASDVVNSMSEIDQSNAKIMSSIDESNKNISEITKVIGDISVKTKVINEIVFQTKLLSFNASVEAARAGEHGKGFAVVAEEVGNLAQMSGNAAKEISTMLEESIQKVEGIVSKTKETIDALMQNGKSKVEKGKEVAQRCGEIFTQVVGNVSSLNEMALEIAAASQEQSQGIQEIKKAMIQMDQVTQQNAGESQTAASASVELSAQATHLKSLVGELNTLIHGNKNLEVKNNENRHSDNQNAPLDNNVLPLKRAKTPTLAANTKSKGISDFEMKKVVGGNSLPSEDDPRFVDM